MKAALSVSSVKGSSGMSRRKRDRGSLMAICLLEWVREMVNKSCKTGLAIGCVDKTRRLLVSRFAVDPEMIASSAPWNGGGTTRASDVLFLFEALCSFFLLCKRDFVSVSSRGIPERMTRRTRRG